MNPKCKNRRTFIKESVVTGAGLFAGWQSASLAGMTGPDAITARVSLVKGPDRADNAFRALQMFKKEIAAAIGNKRVVIKPNFVWYSTALACTHVSFTEGILEFLKSIGKRDVVIAESSAQSNTMSAFDSLGYWGLTKRYPIRVTDLNQEGSASVQIWSSGVISGATLQTIRVSKLLLNPNNFIISATPLKTHNTAVVTLSTKNIAMGAPLYDIGKSFSSQSGSVNDKPTMHGPLGAPTDQNYTSADYQVLNDNVYRLAKVYGIRPHLAVLDGFQGMQGQGPVSGTAIPTPQQLALASLDHVAADRVGLALMGTNVNVLLGSTDQPFPACLNYLGQAGIGEWNLNNIEVVGGTVAGNVYNYTAHSYQTTGYEIANIRATPRD